MVYYIDLRKKRKKPKKDIRKSYRIRFLDTNKFDDIHNVPLILHGKNYIVIETEKGEELVKVLGEIQSNITNTNYKFLRKATKKDFQQFKINEKEAEKALKICKSLAEKYNLKMNLLKAYIPLNNSKILFYYVAENRVDFRELVKELAKRLKNRIEMRQVGVRDGVQILGAVGICGNVCCCSNFIDKFDPVSVEMIENQNLPPIPSKFTGVCGRLMCCLSFEKEVYSVKGELPPVNSVIEYESKEYTIKNHDFIREVVEVVDNEGNIRYIPFEDIKNKDIKIIKNGSTCENCQCKNNNVDNFLKQNYEYEELKEFED